MHVVIGRNYLIAFHLSGSFLYLDHDEIVHLLFVDGLMICEYTGQNPDEAQTDITQDEMTGGESDHTPAGAAAPTPPPAYNDLYGAQ